MEFPPIVRLSLFCLSISCFQQCKSPEPPVGNTGDSLTLVSQGIIEIPVDSVSLNYSVYPVHFVNDTAELYADGNDYVNGIDFYDLDKHRKIKRIIFPREGADGVKFAKKFYIQSLDSIYIYSDDDKLLTLADYNGHVKTRWNLPNRTPWMVNLSAPLTIRDGFAYFSHMMFGDNKQQVGYTTMARYNLTTGEQEEYGPLYPDFFSKGLYMNFTPSLTFGHDGYIVVRFGSLSDLYVYNTKTDSTRIISMKSRYEDASILPDTVAQSFEELTMNLGYWCRMLMVRCTTVLMITCTIPYFSTGFRSRTQKEVKIIFLINRCPLFFSMRILQSAAKYYCPRIHTSPILFAARKVC